MLKEGTYVMFWKKLNEKVYLKALIQENEELFERNKELEKEIVLLNDGDKRKIVDMKKEYERLIKETKQIKNKYEKELENVKKMKQDYKKKFEEFMGTIKSGIK